VSGRALVAGLAFLALVSISTAGAAELSAAYSGLKDRGDLIHGFALGARFGSGSLRWVVDATAASGTLAGSDVREVGLFAGAAYVPWREARLQPFLVARGGVVGQREQVEVFGVAIGPEGVCDGGCSSRYAPAAELGAGLDLRLGGRWALRLAEADWRVRHLDGTNDQAWRVAIGIVRR
jgi:hypothetical protein